MQRLAISSFTEIDDFKFKESGYKKDSPIPAVDESFKPLHYGTVLEGGDKHFWMHTILKTPPCPAPDTKPVFSLCTGREGQWNSLNPQCLIYIDDLPVQGLDTNHTNYDLEFDKKYDIYVYMYTGTEAGHIYFRPSLQIINTEVEALFYDISVPYESLSCLEPTSDDYAITLKYLLMACNMLDMREYYSESFYSSVKKAREFLMTEYYTKVCGNSKSTVTCIGHTHIDVAWLWTLSQTEEKVQRTFSTVIELMRKYPDFVFMSSQPQLYKYVREYAPELYKQIKERVKEGRFEPEGAMWLEADCNLSSGESLVRQIMFGKKFFKEEFGVDSKILWLPDVFGYSAAMPQILKKTGVDKFVTSKISWNEFNTLPYDIFMWEGIDGSKIFTSFITAREHSFTGSQRQTTYVAKLTPQFVIGARKRVQQKQYINSAYVTFGYGDGGGGPTREMLENHERLKYGLPGIPKTVIEPIGNYLERLKSEFDKACTELRKTPSWCGELYLEFHRGTY
ncbi:MAG: alpha-mannosidase, partial [Clostridia bacterium]|nr:alpha-mannosidase [Clostridia bacterium]